MELFLEGPAGRLEATLWEPDGPVQAAAVVCHPHPLHGGTKQNNVVYRVARGLQAAGVAALRFNFRGVGQSAGEHDDGRGEMEDARTALDELARRYPEAELWGAGFSFGARTIAALALDEPRIRRTLLVALPVQAYELEHLADLAGPGLCLMAGRDEFGTLDRLREVLPGIAERFELEEIPDVDHFFSGQTQEVAQRVEQWARRSLAARTR